MKQLNIGLFGFGVVGEGIYQVLSQKPQLKSNIRKIVIKHPDKKRNAPSELFSVNMDDILEDDKIDVVIELIDDADAAFEIAKKALQKGKDVVSANKKMIAQHHVELIDLQRENNVSFLYEAAVCGSVPILRNLEEYYDNDLLNYVRGIVNGSTNYILTKMRSGTETYDVALKAAQENGFAESDPTLDVEGIDASYKLSIITLHAFGRLISSKDVLRKGITSLKPDDFQYAAEKGYIIKLIANSTISEDGRLIPTVLPTFVDKRETLALVNNEYNGVLIGSALADEQFLYGKGAGRFPTSSAVLSDISALRYNYKYELRKGFVNGFDGNLPVIRKFYIGFNTGTPFDSSIFTSIDELYRSREHEYITGEIELNKLRDSGILTDKNLSIIAFT
ncbi:MAG: homoserine dehydrogenase [Prevotellaceae bacterium]|jgi:homoserine dehydrogenase|nr:homoserine dehydrogenase [Prevotellaceae bacterium]